MFSRYAIYYLPPAGDLATFGAGWLGWDVETGQPRDVIALPELHEMRTELTAPARKYGFHATLKAPFRLRDESSVGALLGDLRHLAKAVAPARSERLTAAHEHGFVALRPTGDTRDLGRVAAAMVAGLDHHRAPLTERDLARRRTHGLDARQEANLAMWGYPHVMDQFALHLTLTGHVEAAIAARVLTALEPVLAPVLPDRFDLDAVALVGETPEGFTLIERVSLTGGTALSA